MFDVAEVKPNPNTLIFYQRDSPQEDQQVLEEIQLLAKSAGARIVDTVTAFRRKPDSATYMGKGKLEEIRELANSEDIELLILNHSVSPIQERNIERALKIRTLDRTGLIWIFLLNEQVVMKVSYK